MIKPVVHDPALLSQVAVPATKLNAATVTDLLDTLQANADNCVGMAANMIGINQQIIVVQMGPIAVPMINPKIVAHQQPYQTREGCLSLTGERPTQRYRQITVRYLDRNFQPQQQTFNDFIAQIIQHEVDHLAGILI